MASQLANDNYKKKNKLKQLSTSGLLVDLSIAKRLYKYNFQLIFGCKLLPTRPPITDADIKRLQYLG